MDHELPTESFGLRDGWARGMMLPAGKLGEVSEGPRSGAPERGGPGRRMRSWRAILQDLSFVGEPRGRCKQLLVNSEPP